MPLDKKIVMYSGHLFEWKGADVLLEAARKFQVSSLRFRGDTLFVFVGGTDYDVEKFRQKAEGLNNVLILGHRPYDQIPVLLKAADILVLPNSSKEEISNRYTSPLKLFEYMASGQPIVASDLPSIHEVLNSQNSVLVKPGSAEDLARGIKIVLDMPDNGAMIAQRALEDVQQYSWQKRAEKILDFLR